MRAAGDPARTEIDKYGISVRPSPVVRNDDADGMSRHLQHVPPDHDDGLSFLGL